jgi:hypothetical protein
MAAPTIRKGAKANIHKDTLKISPCPYFTNKPLDKGETMNTLYTLTRSIDYPSIICTESAQLIAKGKCLFY